jgi:hypothetical protein
MIPWWGYNADMKLNSPFRLAAYPVPLVFFATIFIASGIAQNLPKAEEIIERYIAVTGGKLAHEKLKNQLARGSVEYVGAGIRGTIEVYKERPNKARKLMILEVIGNVAQGTNGKVAWERTPNDGPRVLEGEAAAVALRDATFLPRLRWKELYSRAVCLGEERIGDQDCLKVILTPRVGNPVTHYYAKGSGLLVKAFVVVKSETGELTQESFLEDYREVNGIQIHHAVRQRITGRDFMQEVKIQFEMVRFNVEMPKGTFDLPADIQVLVERAKKPR